MSIAQETPKPSPSQDDESSGLDAILCHLGEMGRYQKLLFLGMLPFGFFFAFVYFVQMFVAATPQRHWCRVPELDHLDMELRRNLSAPGAALGEEWDKCSTYRVNWSEVLANLTPPAPGTPTEPCRHGWEYELTDIPYHTVVSERGWVCENDSYAPTAQAVFFAGAFVGGMLFGWIADRFGRVAALMTSNLVGCFGGIATIFTRELWDFVLCRFLVGMSFNSCFTIMYILMLEYVGPRHRTCVANMSTALFFGGGCVILPWLALWIANWRTLLWVTSLPMLIVVAAPWLIPESARWLLSRGLVDQAVRVLKKFEKVNGTTIPENVLDKFIEKSRQAELSTDTLITLARSGPLRTMLLVVISVYMVCALVYDALERMSDNLGMDFFIAFTLISATEAPSVILLVLLLDRLGRRIMTSSPLVSSGILILIAIFVPTGIPRTALVVCARFFISMSFSAIIQWVTELLPTGVRASGSSAMHMSGYVASMLSPFIIFSGRVWSALPLLTLGVLALAASGCSVLLPETKGRALPQTMQDGEHIVREHSLFGLVQALSCAGFYYFQHITFYAD